MLKGAKIFTQDIKYLLSFCIIRLPDSRKKRDTGEDPFPNDIESSKYKQTHDIKNSTENGRMSLSLVVCTCYP